VDAVCINQSDLPEREAQIAMMGSIYSKASSVRVWLGAREDDSEKAVINKKVHTVFNQLEEGLPFSKVCRKNLNWPSRFLPGRKFFQACENDPRYRENADELVSAISYIFERPWWSRLWVVQEVILAPTVQIQLGDWMISFDTLMRAHDNIAADVEKNCSKLEEGFGHNVLRIFMVLLDSRIRPIKICKVLYQMLSSNGNQPGTRQKAYLDFVEILATCRTREATDLRDKIYGLLGLAPAHIHQEVIPSYATSARKVLIDTAYQILQASESFMLFNVTADIEYSTLGLPSWVPDWEAQHRSDLGGLSSDLRLRKAQEEMFKASGNVPWDAVRVSDNVIQVTGFRIDTIIDIQILENDCTDTWRMYCDIDNLITDLYDTYDWQKPARSYHLEAQNFILRSTYPSGITVRDALAKTIIHDCVPDVDGSLRRPSPKDQLKAAAWLKGVSTPYNTEIVKRLARSIHFNSGMKASVGEFIRRILRGRVFLSTHLGYIGMTSGENSCQVGDEVWVLAGASFPVVLRPVAKVESDSSTHKEYLLRSEAYVQGAMFGETVSGKSPTLHPSEASPPDCAKTIRKELVSGRRDWPPPEWTSIRLV
jgi:hypothetical protein